MRVLKVYSKPVAAAKSAPEFSFESNARNVTAEAFRVAASSKRHRMRKNIAAEALRVTAASMDQRWNRTQF